MLFVSFSLQVHLGEEQCVPRRRNLFGAKGCLFRDMDLQSQPAADRCLQFPSYIGRFIKERWERQSRAGGCIKKPLCYFSEVRSASMDWFPLEGEKIILQKQSFSNGGAHCCWRQLTTSSPHPFWYEFPLEEESDFCWKCGQGAQMSG